MVYCFPGYTVFVFCFVFVLLCFCCIMKIWMKCSEPWYIIALDVFVHDAGTLWSWDTFWVIKKKRWCRLQSYNVNHHWRVLYLDIIYVYMCVYVYTDISIFIDILFLIHIMILIFYRQICLKCTIHRYCEERISSPMGFWVYTSYKCIHAQSWNNNIEIITN